MKMNSSAFALIIFLLALPTTAPTSALASGEGCTAAQKARAEKSVLHFENTERAGKTRDAYDGALAIQEIDCAMNGYKRREVVLERVSKKLGSEAENAGRFGEAFDYYRTPHMRGRVDYNLSDAFRALLKHVKANTGDYKIVFEATRYFEQNNNQANLKETRAIAKASGEKTLAAEDKAFAASRVSLSEVKKARDWLDIAGEAKRANARAEQRGDTLLAHGDFNSVERAFQYYDFADNKQKLKSAEARARKLGDEHAKNGQTRVAAQFYDLAGDTAKSDALQKKMDAQEERNEKGETKRQDQFKKDQQSLEKALGL